MPEQKAPSQSGAKVTVACKLPAGIEMRLFDMVKVRQPLMGGGFREVDEARVRASAGSVFIRGNAVPHNRTPRYRIVAPGGALFTDGFALTANVSKDFFDEWMSQNKDSDLVRNGLIFAHDKADSAAAMAKERIKERSGLEPMLQEKDPRAPRPMRLPGGSISGIESNSSGEEEAA